MSEEDEMSEEYEGTSDIFSIGTGDGVGGPTIHVSPQYYLLPYLLGLWPHPPGAVRDLRKHQDPHP